MLAIPDHKHKFLRRACSRCLFMSACLNVLVDLQQSDNTVVPLPLPGDSVWGQVTLPTFLSDKEKPS